MTILLLGMLLGAAIIATIAASGSRAVACLAAGVALLLLAAGSVATLPAGQTLCVAPVLQSAEPIAAPALLGLLIAAAALGGFALGWSAHLSAASAETAAEQRRAVPAEKQAEQRRAADQRRAVLECATLGACLLAALIAAGLGQISLPRALLAGGFAGAAIVAAMELRTALADGLPEFRSYWGGLGGGLGGWEVSRQAILLLGVLIFAAAAVAASAPTPNPTPAAPAFWRPC